jgi:hypothetical protein
MALAGAGIRGISVELANGDLQRVCSCMSFPSRLSLLQPLSCLASPPSRYLTPAKETLTGSRIDNSPIEDKFISTVVSYTDSNAAPVAVQTKSRSSSEANNLPSSTLVPLPSGVPREEAVAEPALNLPPDGEATSAAVESLHGSTRGPSTDEPPPEASGSQEVKESAGFYGSAASPRSHPPLRHAASRRPGVVQADRDNIAKKLNRAELSRLLEGKRALSRAPLR